MYYDKKFLTKNKGNWYYKDRKLNVSAAIDFAYSLSKKADYTAIVVIGQDHEGNIYVLDIDRFKSEKVSEYYKHLLTMISKWDFRKLRAEVTAAQSVIVRELKDNYIRPNGLFLKVEEHRPNRYQGNKEERVNAILQPRYDNLMIYHYKGGHCQTLEEELISRNPPHDDIKDCLASCIETSVKPSQLAYERGAASKEIHNSMTYNRFGGASF
jgi:phage terminase large subunit-like protein